MGSINLIFLTLAIAMNASAFRFRVYSNGGCDHGSPADATFPPNDLNPIEGAKQGVCYSNPTGTNWNRLEIDDTGGHAIITYCDVGCKGGAILNRDGHCFPAPQGCAIGSFYMAA